MQARRSPGPTRHQQPVQLQLATSSQVRVHAVPKPSQLKSQPELQSWVQELFERQSSRAVAAGALDLAAGRSGAGRRAFPVGPALRFLVRAWALDQQGRCQRR